VIDLNDLFTVEEDKSFVSFLDAFKPAWETPQDKKQFAFSPSQVGKLSYCIRALIYSYYDLPTLPITSQKQRIFDNGKHVHLRLQDYIAQAAILNPDLLQLIGDWQCAKCEFVVKHSSIPPEACFCGGEKYLYNEYPVENKDLKIGGTADGLIIWRLVKYLLEIKSMNSFSFAKLKAIPDYYLVQAQLYMFLSGVHKTLFIFECKNTQRFKEFVLEYSYIYIKALLKKIKVAGDYIDNKKLPGRLRGGNKKICSDCEYNIQCGKKEFNFLDNV
jgi:hypothetical protein